LTVTNIYVDGRPEWDRKSADIMGDAPTQTIDELLDEIDKDPAAIFWG
jgi:Protein of unknown function (DUF3024)